MNIKVLVFKRLFIIEKTHKQNPKLHKKTHPSCVDAYGNVQKLITATVYQNLNPFSLQLTSPKDIHSLVHKYAKVTAISNGFSCLRLF